MPFVDTHGDLLTSIELGQVPITAPTFQLRQRIGYYEPQKGPEDTTWADAHVPSLRPESGNRTDLASVPAIFWSLIASYGRQTAPAVLHDAECWRVQAAQKAGTLSRQQAIDERVRIDHRFRMGLRELGVAPFRSWIMWTFVGLERYAKHSIPKLLGMLLLMTVGLGLAVFSTVAGMLGLPMWVAALSLVLPLATSALAGPRWQLLVWASYGGALLLPVAVLQVAAFLPYLLIENVIWAIVDLPKGKGSPQVGPVDVKNIRRAAA
jgi:Protein of unknown function (DUF1353)